MSRKENDPAPVREKDPSEYYRLNTKAVDDLVSADASNSPPVPQAELEKYRSGGKLKLPRWLKLGFIKFWFPAAVCFFFLWGLSPYVGNMLDLLVITGIALGFVTDLLTNNVLRYIAKTKGENDKWMMFPKKGFITLPLNILYAGLLLFFVFNAYNSGNALIIRLTGAAEDSVPVGVEPVLFGILYLAFDLILLGVKHMFGRIVEDAKEKVARGG